MKFVACCLALMVGSAIGHRRSRSSSSDEDFDEYFAFANRGDSSFGYFRRNKEVKTLSIVDIIDMDSEPMYVSNTNPGCDPEKDSNVAIGMSCCVCSIILTHASGDWRQWRRN